ncbi:hypothetical protein ACEWPM_016845 [Roseovarius sp. S4756]|uniref:hypothetical protein n=1 Tax=Roseovarius maritimus TaxID=3342637 RepID=UPI0037267C59
MWLQEPTPPDNDPTPWRAGLAVFALFAGSEYMFGGGMLLLIIGGIVSAVVGIIIADHLKAPPARKKDDKSGEPDAPPKDRP